jgi:hypothetical protein
LQLFTPELAKLPFAECRNEMRIEHVPIVLLGCVFECWQNYGRSIVFDKIAKCADGLRSCLATVDRP